MSKLIIFGTGDIAQIANYYFTIDSEYEVVAFTVNSDFIETEIFEGKPVVAFENIEELYPFKDYKMFIALSYSDLNKVRANKYFEAKNKGYELISYVSSKCTYMSQFLCGDNCFIFEDNTIQPYVKIGNNVTIWSGNHIGHHSILEDHLFISSHVVISGHCKISSFSFLGVNSTIGHRVKIESENIIGAGAIITKNTEFRDVYVPAKSLKIEKKSNQLKL
jgi:sugar O-acyltransferase (sialic acid O-acetyltransferase NeuD family)